MILRLDGATIKREGAVRLGPLDLTLEPSGITMVLGHNGAGKSLFLRMIHGILSPNRGTVTWDDVPAETGRATRGFVFQTTPVLRRSVLANVDIAAPDQDAAMQALERVGLQALARQPAATLSGGEKQRMALARALVSNPAAVVLDEPTASLDRIATALVEETLKQVRAAGVPIVMSTHDLHQARRLADHVLHILDGNIADFTTAERFFGGAASEASRAFLSGE